MKLNNRTKIAVTALVAVETLGEGRPVRLADIADYVGVSLSYLEQLFSKFKQAKLINTFRGPKGGYVVKGDPSVSDVVRAVDSPSKTRIEKSSCDVWDNIFVVVQKTLDEVRIKSLVAMELEDG